MSYRLAVTDDVQRYVSRLSPRMQRRIAVRIGQLLADPYAPSLSKALHGRLKALRSCYLGDFRILFQIDESTEMVRIASIGPRGDIYKVR